MTKVAILTPIHRPWMLYEFIDCTLRELQASGIGEMLYLCDNSPGDEATEELLRSSFVSALPEGSTLDDFVHLVPFPTESRHLPFYIRTVNNDLRRITAARVALQQRALRSDATHFLTLDSDTLLPRGILERLVGHGLDVVAGMGMNAAKGIVRTNARKITDPPHDKVSMGTQFHHYTPFGDGQLHEVGAVCACVLYTRKAFELMDYQADDLCHAYEFALLRQCIPDFRGALSLRQRGIVPFIDEGAKTLHCYDEAVLDSYRKTAKRGNRDTAVARAIEAQWKGRGYYG